MERLTEIGVVNFDINSLVYKFFENGLEGIIFLSFEKFGN
jgi:hypothetical protein